MDWRLDRGLPVSVTEQIKGQIIYAISFGTLQNGEMLPSVRELAKLLGVSPVTISKVYRDLIQAGLLTSKPYVGVYVSEMEVNRSNHQKAAHNSLTMILENTFRQARLMGYSIKEIHDAFTAAEEQISAREQKKKIVIISYYPQATESYASDIAQILCDLNVEVHSLTYDELVKDIQAHEELLKGARVVLTVPMLIQELRRLLEPKYCRVYAIAVGLSAKTIEHLSHIRPDQRVGILSSIPEFMQTMVNELESYGLVINPPLMVNLNQTNRIKDMLEKIDVLVYASGTEKVLEWVPDNVEAFELLHSPKPESVDRLRTLLM